MRPKNRVMCPDCGKQKMLFETERKAQDFLRWNSAEIPGGESLRPYYCKACCGWHLTHVRTTVARDETCGTRQRRNETQKPLVFTQPVQTELFETTK